MGTSPAYVTRLFRGSANLSVQTMNKLAHAVNSTLMLKLVANDELEPPSADAAA